MEWKKVFFQSGDDIHFHMKLLAISPRLYCGWVFDFSTQLAVHAGVGSWVNMIGWVLTLG